MLNVSQCKKASLSESQYSHGSGQNAESLPPLEVTAIAIGVNES